MSLWVDVTSLLHWRGRPTGIPRVAGSLVCEWWAAQQSDLRFCQFDSNCSFVAVPEAQMRDWVACNMTATSTPTTAASEPPPSRSSRIKASLKPAYLRLPKWLRAPVKGTGYAVLGAARRVRSGVAAARSVAGQALRSDSENPTAASVPFARGDVLFSAGLSWDIPNFGGIVYGLKKEVGFHFVPLIYDMIPHWFPHFFGPGLTPSYQGWAADVLWAADVVLTISENSKRDVIAFARQAGTPEPPVEVIRLGDNLPSECDSGTAPPGSGLTRDEPFVLTVGTIEVRKNHLLAYQVWRRLIEECGSRAPKLVIVGRQGWLSGDLLTQIQSDPLTRGRVVVLTDVADADLGWLYRHCLFTMYPSHYEGWGLPVAESLCHGKYCVASRASSLPEVGGKLIAYHDPLDLPECLRLVREALSEDFRTRREELIRTSYRPTRWSETAKRAFSVCQMKLATEETEITEKVVV
jgi:glycosyltransferase involved in cell wall biosynthesis